MFQPLVPFSGVSGWNLLASTYDNQLESYSKNPQVQNDARYLREKLSEPMTQEDFVSDRRLLRITMTAFDLAGEEWKKGFIDKALTESVTPDSSFLDRLGNDAYTKFTEAFAPVDGMISITLAKVNEVANDFQTRSFELAVGEIDNSMRLSLNYKSSISDLIGDTKNNETIVYRILGDVPTRTIFESALSLPTEFNQLPIEKQEELFSDKLLATFGISDLAGLDSPDMIESVLRRYHAIEGIDLQSSLASSASIALTVLNNGLGAEASQNLFISNLS